MEKMEALNQLIEDVKKGNFSYDDLYDYVEKEFKRDLSYLNKEHRYNIRKEMLLSALDLIKSSYLRQVELRSKLLSLQIGGL